MKNGKPLPADQRGLGSSELVGILADEIRKCYIVERRIHQEMLTGRPSRYNSSEHWDGRNAGRKSNMPQEGSAGRKPIWPSLAQFMLKHGLDPLHYIHAVFQIGVRGFPPKPNQLKSEELLRDYRQHNVMNAHAIEVAFQHQKVVFETQVDMLDDPIFNVTGDQAVQCVLLNDSLSLSALFRFCIAVRGGYPDIYRRYREAAAMQYMRHREQYAAVWGKLIPRKFAREAESIYRSLLDRLIQPATETQERTRRKRHG